DDALAHRFQRRAVVGRLIEKRADADAFVGRLVPQDRVGSAIGMGTTGVFIVAPDDTDITSVYHRTCGIGPLKRPCSIAEGFRALLVHRLGIDASRGCPFFSSVRQSAASAGSALILSSSMTPISTALVLKARSGFGPGARGEGHDER